ncbi:hypothetical protein BGX30_005835, partial [Mortierella sp. GBA39]
MEMQIQPMTREAAARISTWRYPAPYDFYSMAADEEDILELMNGDYAAASDSAGNLVGFYCTGNSARVAGGYGAGLYEDDTCVDYGLGMNPELTGQGAGLDFVKAGMAYVSDKFPGKGIRLAVAKFNQRAAKVYSKAGFRETCEFSSMVNNMRIALFDSGLGGLTVLSEAVKQLPNEDFLFFADTLHVPYGTKTKDQVLDYVRQSVDMILQDEIKALVIACNTATSAAAEELRREYDIPIIGMEPAVKPAVERNRLTGKRVLVAATPLTLHQSKYTQLVSRVDDHSIVDSLPLPELVGYCESLEFDPDRMTRYFLDKFADYRLEEYGTLVLGCTHYPFYTRILRQILPPHIEIIDGSAGTVRRLDYILKKTGTSGTQRGGDIRFACSSGDPEYMAKMHRAYDYYSTQVAGYERALGDGLRRKRHIDGRVGIRPMQLSVNDPEGVGRDQRPGRPM